MGNQQTIRIGVIAVGYQCAEQFRAVMSPWAALRCGVYDEDVGVRVQEPQLDIKICCTTALFKEHHDAGFTYDNKPTEDILEQYKAGGVLDEYVVVREPIVDYVSRNHCLDYLGQFDIDLYWQLDLFDEYYTQSDILKILAFIQRNSLVDWYRVNFKNYVGDEKHYVEGFAPPRIHWAKRNGGVNRFYWDNELNYKNGKRAEQCSSLTIPESVAQVRHLSWCGSPEFLKRKIAYQHRCLGHCSYRWDETKGLVLDESYYNKTGETKPIINEETT